MEFRPFSRLFRKHRHQGGKQSSTRNIRLSEGFYKELKAFAKEYTLTLVASGDFIGAKAIEKLVEEQKEKATKRELQFLAQKQS